MNLRNILEEFFPKKSNSEISTVDVLILLICNLTIGKAPLYELNDWAKKLNLKALNIELDNQSLQFTDDRFGRALDKLFEADRASLITQIVMQVIESFNIKLDQIHNDSTTIKAFGEYSGKSTSGLEFKKGRSKDHRPDLKQLVYTLTISNDGAVPIHHKVYSGNQSDSSTHIETWKTLSSICSKTSFLYVADSKLCTDKQLNYITEHGGRAITVVPENWKEVKDFKEALRNTKKSKTEIWRRLNEENEIVYYYSFDEKCYSKHRGYKIHWILSTDTSKEDKEQRERLLNKSENDFKKLLPQLNKRNLKTQESIQNKCEAILKKRKVEKFFIIEICKTNVEYTKKRKRKDKIQEIKVVKEEYTLSWKRNNKALKAEENVDGVFPLLTTDKKISSREVIQAFKYQPKLEKRFSQFKSVHNAAPIFLKKITRVEANMFLFFISLMIQALIEREIRNKMVENKIENLTIYPESREALHPTTNIIFDRFSSISSYEIIEQNSDLIEYYQDELSETQQNILKMLGIEEHQYWKGIKLPAMFLKNF